MYMPVDLKGKDILTSILKEIRKIGGLSGRCRVIVPMDTTGWKKIIASSGFDWIQWKPKPLGEVKRDVAAVLGK